jgi:hypothetical protein
MSNGRDLYLRAIADGKQTVRPINIPYADAAHHLALEEYRRLAYSELFHITGQMTDLVKVSSTSLPEFTLTPADLPSPFGFIYFADPVQTIDYSLQGGGIAPVVAMSWGPWKGSQWPDGGVWVTTYTDTWATLASGVDQGHIVPATAELVRKSMPPLSIDNECQIPFSVEPIGEDPQGGNELVRIIRSTWLLMGQSISQTEILSPDRALRRRFQRQGKEPPSVRVISLRRPRRSDGDDDSNGRDYSHQWIVRGHWRQQWYPSVNDHRPVWIAPHIKGPEGAPLLGGDRVYSLKR